jgi:hypothetical protein
MSETPTPDRVSLIDALLARRSRRFARGMRLDAGPLAFASSQPPAPLSLEEEALLAFAACGVTGYALAELPYQGGSAGSGGGNIMAQFVGRTVASGDAMHDCVVFVLNDHGAWMLRRPQDFPRSELPVLVEMARQRRFVELYEQGRVRVADRRPDPPRAWPFVPPFNLYSANVPGATYFLPVIEVTALYVNVLLASFEANVGTFVVDDHNGYQPAGLAAFARSAGGHLHDDPAQGRFATVSALETAILEFCAVELGGVLQNLGLMAAALGLGGFPHWAAHPFVWCQELGFRMESVPVRRLMGLPAEEGGPALPTPVGLERDGQVLLKPFCPPYYRDMAEAVRAFVDFKLAPGRGTFRDGGAVTGWKDGAAVQAGIPGYSEQAIAATVAYCDYVYGRYGRFPAASGPLHTLLAFQAHHLDPEFYDRFYRPEAAGLRAEPPG